MFVLDNPTKKLKACLGCERNISDACLIPGIALQDKNLKMPQFFFMSFDTFSPWFGCITFAGCFLQSGWNNFRWKVKEISQILDSLVGQVVVTMSPCKVFPDISTGF